MVKGDIRCEIVGIIVARHFAEHGIKPGAGMNRLALSKALRTVFPPSSWPQWQRR